MVISSLECLQIRISLELSWFSVRRNMRWVREGLAERMHLQTFLILS